MKEIGNYAAVHGTKATIDGFLKIYTKFSLKRTTVNAWREKFKKKKFFFSLARKNRKTNLVEDEM